MRQTGFFIAIVGLLLAFVQSAFATVSVHVDISSQTMTVNSNEGSYSWPVSTGRAGFNTPNGTYRPQRMLAVAYSHKYHNSPMPHSIFFRGGYAIHGSYETGNLGRAASHGCVRLAPGNAATLFSLVKREGAVITISGSNGQVYAARHHGSKSRVASRRHKGETRMAGRRHHGNAQLAARSHVSGDQGYYSYTSQHEPAPVQQWLADPASNY